MDNIWKNAARKLRARDLRNATVEPAPTAPVTVTAAVPIPSWCDPETLTLAQIDENSCRLQRDWPKEDGIPFPPDMLETLGALRAAVIARDARKGTTAPPLAQTVPTQSAETATETASKKAAKKRRLREKRATARTTASPVVSNPPAAIAIDSNLTVIADCSPNPIGADMETT